MMDSFRAKTERIMEELLDFDDELLEFMFIDQAVSNSAIMVSPKHGGSWIGRRKALQRERQARHERI